MEGARELDFFSVYWFSSNDNLMHLKKAKSSAIYADGYQVLNCVFLWGGCSNGKFYGNRVLGCYGCSNSQDPMRI